MTFQLTIKLPDDLRQPLTEVAALTGQTPEEWIMAVLRRQLPRRDDRLRRHFGAVDLGYPTGASNEAIDADLARALTETHGPA
jgi:hypothetical protein